MAKFNTNKTQTQSMGSSTSNHKSKRVQKTDIWLVDDSVLFQDCIIELINDTPDLMCSNSFISCEDALRQMASKPNPDVLLLDIELPGMSGIDGIQKFKEISPVTQIIMLTGNDESDRIFEAICAGADG